MRFCSTYQKFFVHDGRQIPTVRKVLRLSGDTCELADGPLIRRCNPNNLSDITLKVILWVTTESVHVVTMGFCDVDHQEADLALPLGRLLD